MREHQYIEGYAKSLEGKRVPWDGENTVDHMWEQLKREMVGSAREVCGSVSESRMKEHEEYVVEQRDKSCG